jgi:hypothetical protein
VQRRRGPGRDRRDASTTPWAGLRHEARGLKPSVHAVLSCHSAGAAPKPGPSAPPPPAGSNTCSRSTTNASPSTT